MPSSFLPSTGLYLLSPLAWTVLSRVVPMVGFFVPNLLFSDTIHGEPIFFHPCGCGLSSWNDLQHPPMCVPHVVYHTDNCAFDMFLPRPLECKFSDRKNYCSTWEMAAEAFDRLQLPKPCVKISVGIKSCTNFECSECDYLLCLKYFSKETFDEMSLLSSSTFPLTFELMP